MLLVSWCFFPLSLHLTDACLLLSKNRLKRSWYDLLSLEPVRRRQAFEGASFLILSIFRMDFEKSYIFHISYINTAVC